MGCRSSKIASVITSSSVFASGKQDAPSVIAERGALIVAFYCQESAPASAGPPMGIQLLSLIE
jgi:hypothetical protein